MTVRYAEGKSLYKSRKTMAEKPKIAHLNS
nr:MAG TPA: hypothetical protein [Caudoviricetes sp.]